MTLETALQAPAAEEEDEEAEDAEGPRRGLRRQLRRAGREGRPLSQRGLRRRQGATALCRVAPVLNAKPETDAENKRMVASVKRKQAALAYAAAVAKGEDAHMEDDAVDAIGLAVLVCETLLDVDDVPDAPEHLGVLAEKGESALGATGGFRVAGSGRVASTRGQN